MNQIPDDPQHSLLALLIEAHDILDAISGSVARGIAPSERDACIERFEHILCLSIAWVELFSAREHFISELEELESGELLRRG